MTVGSLPDMLVFTHDGSKLLVANEATPNTKADDPYILTQDPRGTVSILDVETRTVIATAGFENVPRLGANLRTNVGMDFEPAYIAVEKDGARAFVTLQGANAIAVLDLGEALVDCTGDLWSIKSQLQAPSSNALPTTNSQCCPARLGVCVAVGCWECVGAWSLGIDTLLMTRTVH